MNIEKIAEIINKIPFTFFLVVYLSSLGYDYYSFNEDQSSQLNVKKAELASLKSSNSKLQIKVAELQKFLKVLDDKKVELRRLLDEFQRVGSSLADKLDTPLFMKMIVTEAKKIGLKIEGLKPLTAVEKDFYLENTFSFSYRGVFGQLVVFLQRLANTTEIIHIDDINIKPVSSSSGRFVELKGDMVIRTYTYIPAKAEEMVKQLVKNSNNPPVPPVGSPPSGAPSGPSIKPGGAPSLNTQAKQGKPS